MDLKANQAVVADERANAKDAPVSRKLIDWVEDVSVMVVLT
jgi:hypothetical protein